MLKAIYAVIAAGILAASFFVALSISAEVEARGSAAGSKGDRADARVLAGACSAHPWPYFESSCLRDTRKPFGQADEVRLVSLHGAAAGVEDRDLRAVKPHAATPTKGRDARGLPAGRRADARVKARPVR
jgi:hypothetical protein